MWSQRVRLTRDIGQIAAAPVYWLSGFAARSEETLAMWPAQLCQEFIVLSFDICTDE
jgi:hypothetical protein